MLSAACTFDMRACFNNFIGATDSAGVTVDQFCLQYCRQPWVDASLPASCCTHCCMWAWCFTPLFSSSARQPSSTKLPSPRQVPAPGFAAFQMRYLQVKLFAYTSCFNSSYPNRPGYGSCSTCENACNRTTAPAPSPSCTFKAEFLISVLKQVDIYCANRTEPTNPFNCSVQTFDWSQLVYECIISNGASLYGVDFASDRFLDIPTLLAADGWKFSGFQDAAQAAIRKILPWERIFGFRGIRSLGSTCGGAMIVSISQESNLGEPPLFLSAQQCISNGNMNPSSPVETSYYLGKQRSVTTITEYDWAELAYLSALLVFSLVEVVILLCTACCCKGRKQDEAPLLSHDTNVDDL